MNRQGKENTSENSKKDALKGSISTNLPDVAIDSVPIEATPKNKSNFLIDWVGMERIEIPIKVLSREGIISVIATVSAKVSLDLNESRGIHMSRLYYLLHSKFASNPVSIPILRDLTEEFLASHQGISSSSEIRLRYQYPALRKSLKSGVHSYRVYPTEISISNIGGEISIIREIEILYSSTCPASAALSRQLIKRQFIEDFYNGELDSTPAMEASFRTKSGTVNLQNLIDWFEGGKSLVATPHAQRSKAVVKLRYDTEICRNYEEDLEDLITHLESSVQTPVQTLVKREDEQEFARLNGQNLLFCEDAVRRISHTIEEYRPGIIIGYRVKVEHYESLHPHNATALKSKNW